MYTPGAHQTPVVFGASTSMTITGNPRLAKSWGSGELPCMHLADRIATTVWRTWKDRNTSNQRRLSGVLRGVFGVQKLKTAIRSPAFRTTSHKKTRLAGRGVLGGADCSRFLGRDAPMRQPSLPVCPSDCRAAIPIFNRLELTLSRPSCQQPQHIKELNRMFPLDPSLLCDR